MGRFLVFIGAIGFVLWLIMAWVLMAISGINSEVPDWWVLFGFASVIVVIIGLALALVIDEY